MAQLVVTPSVLPTLLESLKQVSDIPVSVTSLPLSSLLVGKRTVKEVSTVEASLRLDAIASAGFGLSRSKVMDLISDGQVLLNWKEATKAYNLQVM